ncbi:hypothetical protein [Companilactobacillus ginsenosidimutans]|nr:hypothetical protein [Companilactobacillus ginsenosidimutans]
MIVTFLMSEQYLTNQGVKYSFKMMVLLFKLHMFRINWFIPQ